MIEYESPRGRAPAPRSCFAAFRAALIGSLAVVALASVGGCATRNQLDFVPARSGSPIGDFLSAYVEGEQQEWTFEGAEIVEVDVESVNGDVIIVADPRYKNTRVTMLPQAVNGYERGDEAKAAVTRVTAQVDKVPGDLGPRIEVRTSTTDPEPYYIRAHVTIEAPSIEGVRVRTSRGNVMLKNVAGAIDVSTTGGNVRLMTPQPLVKPVTIVNKDGDIDYRVRGESTGYFDMATVGGIIKLRCRYGRWIAVDPGNTQDRMVASLNGGENPVVLRTVDGDIRVAVVSNPMEVGLFIVDP